MVIAPVCEVQEIWTVERTQEAQYLQLLNTAGVSAQYVEDILSRQLVSIGFGDLSSEPILIRIPSIEIQSAPTLLRNYGEISVYYPREPKTPNHLWVALNRPVDHFSEVSLNEAVSLRRVVNTLTHLLHTKRCFPDVVIAQWNEPQPDHLSHRFIIEIIPPRPESREVHNARDKVEFNNYILFKNRYTSSLPVVSETEREDDISFWRKSLVEEPIHPLTEKHDSDPINEWIHIQTSKGRAEKVLTNHFYETLQQEGIVIERNIISDVVVEEDHLEVKKPAFCPFCADEIMASQEIYKTSFSRVLYNFKPSNPGLHFLILPLRHVRRSEKLIEAEIKDMHILTLLLIEIFKQMKDRFDVEILTQDGPSVGQTVAHTHTHVMLRPFALQYLLVKINFDREPSLTREQMAPVVQEIGTRLRELFKGMISNDGELSHFIDSSADGQ